MNTKELLSLASKAAILAGEEILKIYNTEFEVEHKVDNSPLTLADQAAHNAIMFELKSSDIPVLSEEGKSFPYEERKQWNRLWIVDPLDGTKEFVKRNGEFTVNIALIENQFPILGVIFVPVSGELFIASQEYGAFLIDGFSSQELLLKIEKNQWMESGKKLPLEPLDSTYKIVASRSHMSTETENFIKSKEKEKGKVELMSMGSSLKICLVAQGKADIYPRFAPTMEWDTAAGQAIAEAAGKSFVDYTTGERMRYNRENLLNNWFLVS